MRYYVTELQNIFAAFYSTDGCCYNISSLKLIDLRHWLCIKFLHYTPS